MLVMQDVRSAESHTKHARCLNILKQAKQYAIVSTSFTKDTEHCSQIEFGTLYDMQLS